jgi:serine protease inhibitor
LASDEIVMKSSKIISRGILSGILAFFIGFSVFAVRAQDLEKLATADNAFAFDLFKQIAKGRARENIFISPFSVSSALQMVANGAAGETKTEMQRVLKTENLPPEQLNAACKELNESLNSQKDVILNLANGIWFQKDFQLKPGFVSDNENFFQTELAPVDFKNPKSADIVNNWAEKKTHGKIKDVVSFPFPPLTKVILADAIYFKGKWAEPFDRNETKPRVFHLPDGGEKQMPMMSQHRHFSYQETDDFQAVQMSYAGNRLEMILFLPKTNSSPQKLLVKLSGSSWQDDAMSQFEDREGTVAFPKFKLDYNVELNEPLENLGMRQAFSSSANFSAMSDESLFISEVKQKSFIAVDEEGTEAAAVTGISVAALGPEPVPQPPFEMIVDRPFFFVIADGRTQTILFMGIVNEPNAGN